jgi:DNA-binding NarL/FixJ family response regulator
MESTFATDRSSPLPTRAALVVIDSKLLTLHSITQMLAKAWPAKETIPASSGEKLIESQDAAASDPPPLVVLYIRSASVSDCWVQREIRLVWGRFPAARVALLSDRDEADEVAQAISCGVRGYIPTSVDCDVAFAALRLIDVGGTYIPAYAVCSNPKEPNVVPKDELNLTDREISVARLLCTGMPNKVIARTLEIQETTVKVHVRHILKKLHVTNRTQAASIADRVLSLVG